MPVPSRITDLSATAADNSPAGTDTVGPNLDDYLRGIQAVLRGDLATKGADIASATTTDLGAVQGFAHDITGTTTITSFGTVAAGVHKLIKFEGALTLTHNATSLILPGGENIPTADGDTALMVSEGSGNWRCYQYVPAAINPAKTVSTDESQTLTNKTLTSPTIQGTVGAGTGLTMPAFVLSGNITQTGNPSLNIGSGALTAGATSVTTLTASTALIAEGTQSSNLLQVKAAGGGDAFLATALSAGNGAAIGALNSTFADYEPLQILGETVDVRIRNGVGTAASVALFTSTGLNNTVIGATTPAAGSFTTVTASGDVVAGGGVRISRNAGTGKVTIADENTEPYTAGFDFRSYENGGTGPAYRFQNGDGSANYLEIGGSVSGLSVTGALSTTKTGADNLLTITGGVGNAKGLSLYDTAGTPTGGQIYSVDNDLRFFTNTAGSIVEKVRIVPSLISLYTDTAVTGALSATGKYSALGTAASNWNFLEVSGSTTSPAWMYLSNTSGAMTLGIEGSVGGLLGSTTTAYSTVISSASGKSMHFLNGTTTAMTLDASGNLGLGVTPSAWATSTAVTALQLPNGSLMTYSNAYGFSNIYLSANAYLNNSGNWTYTKTNSASLYTQEDGSHKWSSAPSGTAGNAITFTQAMTLDASGNLLVGTTSAIASGATIVNLGTGRQVLTLKGDTDVSYTLGVWSATTSGDNLFAYFGTETSLTVRGSITYNRGGGVVAYNTTSDYRAKDILGDLEGAGETIDQLRVYLGQMKGATIARPMMVAHEAQAVVPYAVTGTKDAVNDKGEPVYQSMDHQILVPLLIAEVQSLRSRVALLESKGTL